MNEATTLSWKLVTNPLTFLQICCYVKMRKRLNASKIFRTCATIRGLYCVFEARGVVETLGCQNGKHLLNCKQHTCPSHFKCLDAYCIPVHTVCDGKAECPYGEDETNCQMLTCPGFLFCRHDKVYVSIHMISGQVMWNVQCRRMIRHWLMSPNARLVVFVLAILFPARMAVVG